MDPLRQQPNTNDPNRVNNSANSTPQPMPGEQFGVVQNINYSYVADAADKRVTHLSDEDIAANQEGSIGRRKFSSYLRLGPLAIALVIFLIIGVLTSLYFLLGVGNDENQLGTPASITNDYAVAQIPLAGLIKDGQISLDTTQQLLVNGQLRANNSFILAPTAEPQNPTTGQIYYSSISNELFYFDGTNFVSLATNQAIDNLGLGGLSGLDGVGSGLAIQGQTLVNSGVLTVQGQSGEVTLTSGGGIGINGLVISNTGVTGLTGTANQISVSAASGNITLSLPQNISTTSAPTFAGLTLGAPLTVASGGTGAGSLAPNGVLIGNGTGPVSSAVAASSGLCLVSTAGAPVFGSCTGTASVTSLNSLSGGLTIAAGSGISVTDNGVDTITIATTSAAGVTDLNGLFGSLAIANSTAAGSTITINDATTAAKGIASFNAADFSVTAGAVSLGTVAVLKGGTGATDAANARSNLGAAASGVNTDITQLNALASVSPLAGVVYGFAPAVAGTYQFCTTAGNCVGAGGEVTTAGGTAGRIAKFTGPSTLADSLLSETATTVAVNGDLQITGIASGNGSGLTGVDAALLGGQAGSFYLNASNINAGTLAVAFGGTGATTAVGARTNLGAAASGVNNDITSMTALTAISPSSALSIGSTGQSLTLQGSATTSLSAYSGAVKTTLGFTLPTGNNSIILPNASGTVAISGSGAITLDANGNITCPNCLTNNGSGGGSGVTSVNTFTGDVTIQAGSGITVTNLAGTITVASTGGSGVTSLNTLSGALTLANSTGAGSTVTIDDASTTQKGIAQFTAADFATAGGVVSLDTSVTKQGNVFNGNGQLIQLDAAGGAATGPGQCLQSTGVGGTGTAFAACSAGGNISSGTSQTAGNITMFDATTNQITDSIISQAAGTITVAGNLTVTGTPQLSTLTAGVLHANATGVITSGLVNLATEVTGTLPVLNGGTGATTASGARTNLGAAASGANSDITSLNATNSITPTAALTIGSSSQSLTMQGTSISLSSYNGLFFSNLQFSSPTGNATIVIPNISGTVALLERNNQTFTGGSQNFKNTADSTTAFRIQSATTSDTLFTANTTNNRIVIGNATAATNVDSTLFVVDSASTVNLPAGVNGGIIYDSTTGKLKIYEAGAYKTLCNTTDLGCGDAAAASTLQGAYDATADAAPEIVLTATQGALSIQDATVALGTNLLAVQNNGGTTTYFGVAAASTTVGNDLIVAAGKTLTIVGGTTASKPASPTEGALYYDQTLDQLQVYSNGKWQSDRTTATKIVAASNSLNKEKADYVADGTADQTEINAALSALPAAGGLVYLLEGTYTVDAEITMGTNKTLAGSGGGTMIQLASSVTTAVNVISGSGSINNVTVMNLKVDGNKAAIASGLQTGIYMNFVGSGSGATAISGARISMVTAQNFTNQGINMTTWGANHTITDSIARANNAEGIYAASQRLTISNSSIQGNGDKGIYVTGSNVTVSNNLIENNTNQGLYNSASNTTISGNKLKSNGDGGPLDGNIIMAGGTNTSVTGNTSEGGSPYGVYMNTNLSSLSGNTVFSSTSHGIYLAADNTTATANSSYLNGGDGVLVSGNQTTVTGNSVTQNTSRGINISSNFSEISGNTITGNTGNGMLFGTNASNNTASGNHLYNNASTGGTHNVSFGQAANNNQMIGNKIIDTAGTGCAIDFTTSNAPANTYLADNVYSGTGATTICNAPANTIFANQQTSSNDIVLQGPGAINIGQTSAGAGTLSVTGAYYGSQLATPGTPTATRQGATGTSTYKYRVTALDGMGETAASAESAGVTNGAATLNATDFVRITFGRIGGATQYRVYRTTVVSGNPSSTGLIGTITAGTATTTSGGLVQFDDTGLAGTTAAPTSNNTGGATFAGSVGIGTAVPAARLHISSGGTDPLFRITDTTVTARDVLNIADGGAATFRNQTNSASGFQIQDSNGTAFFTADTSSLTITVQKLTVTGDLTVNGHIVTGGTAPTAAVNANAGTAATCTVSGNDTSGTITLTTGSGAWAAGTQCTITYNASFAAAPRPVLTPTSNNFGARDPYVGSITTALTLNFAVADTAGATYTFNYFNAQ